MDLNNSLSSEKIDEKTKLLTIDVQNNFNFFKKMLKLFSLELDDCIKNILNIKKDEFIAYLKEYMTLVIIDLYGDNCFENTLLSKVFDEVLIMFKENVYIEILKDIENKSNNNNNNETLKKTEYLFNSLNDNSINYKNLSVLHNINNKAYTPKNVTKLKKSFLYNTNYNNYNINIVNKNNKYSNNFSNNGFIRHCPEEYELDPIHTCGGTLKIIKNIYLKQLNLPSKNVNSDYIKCNKCNTLYFSISFQLKCSKCKVFYYSYINKYLSNYNDNNNSELKCTSLNSALTVYNKSQYLPITWDKYHCEVLVNDPIRCCECKNELYIKISDYFNYIKCNNNYLNLNYYCFNCNSIKSHDSIKTICIICSFIFKPNIKLYNYLELKSYKTAIKEATVINKNIAKPFEVPCCDYTPESLDFYHSKNCSGLLYTGIIYTGPNNLNKISIVVCGLCKTITKSENFIWTCPICLKRFRFKTDNKNNSKFLCNTAVSKYSSISNNNNIIADENVNSTSNKISSINYKLKSNKDNVHIRKDKFLNNEYLLSNIKSNNTERVDTIQKTYILNNKDNIYKISNDLNNESNKNNLAKIINVSKPLKDNILDNDINSKEILYSNNTDINKINTTISNLKLQTIKHNNKEASNYLNTNDDELKNTNFSSSNIVRYFKLLNNNYKKPENKAVNFSVDNFKTHKSNNIYEFKCNVDNKNQLDVSYNINTEKNSFDPNNNNSEDTPFFKFKGNKNKIISSIDNINYINNNIRTIKNQHSKKTNNSNCLIEKETTTKSNTLQSNYRSDYIKNNFNKEYNILIKGNYITSNNTNLNYAYINENTNKLENNNNNIASNENSLKDVKSDVFKTNKFFEDNSNINKKLFLNKPKRKNYLSLNIKTSDESNYNTFLNQNDINVISNKNSFNNNNDNVNSNDNNDLEYNSSNNNQNKTNVYSHKKDLYSLDCKATDKYFKKKVICKRKINSINNNLQNEWKNYINNNTSKNTITNNICSLITPSNKDNLFNKSCNNLLSSDKSKNLGARFTFSVNRLVDNTANTTTFYNKDINNEAKTSNNTQKNKSNIDMACNKNNSSNKQITIESNNILDLNNKDNNGNILNKSTDFTPYKSTDSKNINSIISPLDSNNKNNLFKPNKLLIKDTQISKDIFNIKSNTNNCLTNESKLKPVVIDISLNNISSLNINSVKPSTEIINSMKVFNIEDYKVITKIGEGTYGTIYSVVDTRNNYYALKKIIASDPLELECFRQEYTIMQKIEHPFILTIYGICIRSFESDITNTHILYVLMDLAVSDWNKEIKQKKENKEHFTIQHLVSIMYQIGTAMSFLQSCKISHRDIKPHNILKFKNNVYKLADFGEAKFYFNFNNSNDSVTTSTLKNKKSLYNIDSSTLRGTELYMSPLLFEGLKNNKQEILHDPVKSDVFSFGLCMLYACFLQQDLLYAIRNESKIFLNNNDIIMFNIQKLLIDVCKEDKRFSTNTNNDNNNTIINKSNSFNYNWLIVLLIKMINIEEKQRIDFYIICDELEDHLNELQILIKA